MKQHPIKSDGRYSIQKEFTGHISGKAVFVLRWCGEFIACSPYYTSMVVRAVGHKAARNGALIVEGIPA